MPSLIFYLWLQKTFPFLANTYPFYDSYQNFLLDKAGFHLIFDDIQLDDVTDNSEQRVFSHTDNAIHFNKKVLEPESTESLSNVVRNSEYRTIMSALENTRSRDQAARLLGISTRTLRHKLQRLREDGMAVTRAYAR